MVSSEYIADVNEPDSQLYNQFSPEPDGSTVPYEYTRADGTIETAQTIEEAMGRCTGFLGKMTVEQAGMMLEMASMGRAIQAEEKQIKPPPPRVSEKQVSAPSVPKRVARENDSTVPKSSEQFPISEPIELLVSPAGDASTVHEKKQNISHEPKVEVHATIISAPSLHPIEKNLNLPEEQPMLPSEYMPRDATHTIPEAYELPVAEAGLHVEYYVEHSNFVLSNIRTSVSSETQVTYERAAISNKTEPFENVQMKNDSLPAPEIVVDAVSTDAPSVKLSVIDTVVLTERSEPMEDFEEIVGLEMVELPAENVEVLALNKTTNGETVTIETARLEISELMEAVQEDSVVEIFQLITEKIEPRDDMEAVEIKSVNQSVESTVEAFMDFMVAVIDEELRPAREVPSAENQDHPQPAPPLEEIRQSSAAEQPLEQTLVQVAVYLKQTLESAVVEPTAESVVIMELIKDIQEAIYSEQTGDELEQPRTAHITQEVAAKLFVLLQVLGYEKPQQTLKEFLTRSDLMLLLEAIEYLNQLANEDSRHESVKVRDFTAATTDDEPHQSITVRIGNVLIGSLKHSLAVPAVTALL